MHEPFDYYLDCRLRQRNTGLFIADRVSQCFDGHVEPVNFSNLATSGGYNCANRIN